MPPTLIDCGQAGAFLVFSHFRLGECGPTLYFHSLKTNTCVTKVNGGEIFIDFITKSNTKDVGTLYFLTDKYYFFNNGWTRI